VVAPVARGPATTASRDTDDAAGQNILQGLTFNRGGERTGCDVPAGGYEREELLKVDQPSVNVDRIVDDLAGTAPELPPLIASVMPTSK
jgi:hypothetical protein